MKAIDKHKRCPGCRSDVDVDKFTHPKEVEEYNISGLCKQCQINLYGPTTDDAGRGTEKGEIKLEGE